MPRRYPREPSMSNMTMAQARRATLQGRVTIPPYAPPRNRPPPIRRNLIIAQGLPGPTPKRQRRDAFLADARYNDSVQQRKARRAMFVDQSKYETSAPQRKARTGAFLAQMGVDRLGDLSKAQLYAVARRIKASFPQSNKNASAKNPSEPISKMNKTQLISYIKRRG